MIRSGAIFLLIARHHHAMRYNPAFMVWQHITDEEPVEYHLGIVTDEAESAPEAIGRDTLR